MPLCTSTSFDPPATASCKLLLCIECPACSTTVPGRPRHNHEYEEQADNDTIVRPVHCPATLQLLVELWQGILTVPQPDTRFHGETRKSSESTSPFFVFERRCRPVRSILSHSRTCHHLAVHFTLQHRRQHGHSTSLSTILSIIHSIIHSFITLATKSSFLPNGPHKRR